MGTNNKKIKPLGFVNLIYKNSGFQTKFNFAVISIT